MKVTRRKVRIVVVDPPNQLFLRVEQNMPRYLIEDVLRDLVRDRGGNPEMATFHWWDEYGDECGVSIMWSDTPDAQ